MLPEGSAIVFGQALRLRRAASGTRAPGPSVIFFSDPGHRCATGSASRAARRNALAARKRALHNAPPMFPLPLSTARAGFTLVEMLIAMSILAILIAIAAPSLRDFVMDVRLTGQANDLMADLMLARSEAVKRDSRMALCPRKSDMGKDGKKSGDSCSSGNQWDNGWMVVVDGDADGDRDAGTFSLTVRDTLSGSNKIKNDSKGPKGAVIFGPTGATTSTVVTFFTLCDSREKGRQIVVQPTGRAAVTKIEADCK